MDTVTIPIHYDLSYSWNVTLSGSLEKTGSERFASIPATTVISWNLSEYFQSLTGMELQSAVYIAEATMSHKICHSNSA